MIDDFTIRPIAVRCASGAQAHPSAKTTYLGRSSNQLKGKRNPESDRAAVVSSASWVQATSAQLAPDLPSIAAARGVRQQNTATALQDAPEWMKKLMAK